MADITMPQLGETVTEGTITKWHKVIGEAVVTGEVLLEVSTDKVDSDVPSPVAGVLAEIRAGEGDTVEVGAVICVIEVDAVAASTGPVADVVDDPDAKGVVVPDSPDARPPRRAVDPTGAAHVTEASGGIVGGTSGGQLVSPLVRRLVADHGLDIGQITGTGTGGRITRSDVERAIHEGGYDRSVPPDRTAPSDPVGPPTSGGRRPTSRPQPRSGTGDTTEPFSNIRLRTGEHMAMSKRVSPHAYSIIEVDYENVDRTRRRQREQWKADEGFSLTYLPFISRAVIDALREFPHMNAMVGVGELVVHNYVNLAIAVDLDFAGLLAPVVRDADGKRLRAVAREIVDLAARARTKQLSPDEVTGGTFTITNNGSFGTTVVLPIINQPQVAILSTDTITRRPVVVATPDGGEGIGIHPIGSLALAWDHRAFDGSYAGGFLSEVRHTLETRDWEAEL